MKSIQVEREILRYENGQIKHIEDSIVTEFPVTVKINGQEFVTMVSTPEYIEDMVIGFLASEGIIRKYEDIDEIWVQDKEGYVHVTTAKINPYYRDIQNKRYITSCCGMSRQGFVFANDALTAKKMKAVRVKISAQDCFRLMNDMQQSAATFQNTGGVHNAALCDVNRIVLSRMDIGRHNALDKIYGYCLKNNISIGDKIIVFSGRISSEILLKVAKIGCEVILSKSAPTELALQLAEELGITTIGFIRNQSLNVYTHPERVVNIK
ncbi:formate dehydrogenase accessory sulfurtransferase FdhD [Bacillus pseudomycoides]|uniref:formate dehydrogenase accessory sulfurtransferase FdhD n=1 Tax=Bacillus pseudomycoides TaxID=64104 RepID=UPI000BECD1F6|nr:formate dehydrogenase accessory sulfurtransferase FdhD [Bacillus pseudomycoides]PEE44880.1 formate dehydrogenase family accessory protein FdhD [Bacillus pseudomycoides]PGA85292.1 formate dehydrogenase family accessory protein FdhD [Bacillus pseudomycoides]PHF44888.1 formate dehydrogenase family accessory protein FdhD [Bacillus pseudomycoides]